MISMAASTDSATRKVLLALITVVAVGVWGTVLYQLVAPAEPVSAPNTEARASGPASPSSSDDRFPDFTGSVSDVFTPKIQAQTSPARPDPHRSQRPDPPPELRYQLVGLVNGMAMLNHPNGAVEFARHGDELDGYRITEVQDDRLILRHGARVDTLTLSESEGSFRR
jgi:hypothetical protein